MHTHTPYTLIHTHTLTRAHKISSRKGQETTQIKTSNKRILLLASTFSHSLQHLWSAAVRDYKQEGDSGENLTDSLAEVALGVHRYSCAHAIEHAPPHTYTYIPSAWAHLHQYGGKKPRRPSEVAHKYSWGPHVGVLARLFSNTTVMLQNCEFCYLVVNYLKIQRSPCTVLQWWCTSKDLPKQGQYHLQNMATFDSLWGQLPGQEEGHFLYLLSSFFFNLDPLIPCAWVSPEAKSSLLCSL